MKNPLKKSVIFAPGLINDARLWEPQVKALAGEADCRVADITGADTMAGLAEAVLKQAPGDKFVLAGLSMGGYVSLEILRQAPERVLGLALFDTSARPDTPEATENRRKQMALAEKDFEAVISALIPKWVTPDGLKNAAAVALMADMARKNGPSVFVRQQKAILGRIDSRPHLKDIRCPTLVVCGRQDAITPLAVHEEMAAGIPGARLETIDKAGHLSPLEQPHAVTDVLKEWLKQLTI
jgi:pimeloyl-ACP methyl ester carboxylesterase